MSEQMKEEKEVTGNSKPEEISDVEVVEEAVETESAEVITEEKRYLNCWIKTEASALQS